MGFSRVVLVGLLVLATGCGVSKEGPAPGVATSPPPNSHVEFADVRAFVEHLIAATAELSAPKEMMVEDSFIVELNVTPQGVPSPKPAPADTVTSRTETKIGPVTTAHLTGDHFKIEAITPEQQAVTGLEVANWRWRVEPTKAGNLTLSASLDVPVPGNKAEASLHVRTLQTQVTIKALPPAVRVLRFVSANWQYILTTLLLPALGWLVAQRFRSGRRRGRAGF